MGQMDVRAALVASAAMDFGHVYIWGGDKEEEGGFDCSGFVHRLLSKVSLGWPKLYDRNRRTAAGLYLYFHNRGLKDIVKVEDLKPGCLVFYRPAGGQIFHVALHLMTVPSVESPTGSLAFGPVAMEAGGAGSGATSPRAALLSSAGVRLTASDHHGTAQWVALDIAELA